jgi:hypothetical protein
MSGFMHDLWTWQAKARERITGQLVGLCEELLQLSMYVHLVFALERLGVSMNGIGFEVL